MIAKSDSISTFQKSVVVILLLNLFLNMAGVSAQNNQVDCSKLAFSKEDLPEESWKNYAEEKSERASFIIGDVTQDQKTNPPMEMAKYFSELQCSYSSYFMLRYTDNSRSIDTKIADVRAALSVFGEDYADSVYNNYLSKFSLEEVATHYTVDDRIEEMAANEYGEKSFGYIVTTDFSQVPIFAGQEKMEGYRKIVSCNFKIGSADASLSVLWYEGMTGPELSSINYLNAGFTALKNWSERLKIELGGPPPPPPTSPPVTTGQCNIKIDKDRKKLAVDDISQLTFTGIITGVKSMTDTATSVDLKITAEVSNVRVSLQGIPSSPIKLTLKEEKDIQLQRTDSDPPSFKYVYRPKIRDFSSYDLIPGRAILEASFKDSSGNVLAKCSKEFTLIRTPVLLVHGIWSYSSEMEPMMNYLKSHGFEYVSNYNYGKNPPEDWRDGANGDIKNIALELSTFVYNNLETTLSIDNVNWSRFDIVAHSAGGLVAREYINNNPDKVGKLVTIATPHYGSDAANILVYWMRNSGRIEYDPSWAPTGHRTDVVYDERVRFLINDTRELAGTELLIGRYGVMVEQLTIPGDVVINELASEYIQVPEEGRTRLTRNDIGALPWSLGVNPEIRAGDFIKNLNAPEYDRSLRDISLLCIAANRSDFGFFTVANDGIVTVASATSLAVRLNRPYQVIQHTDHTNVKNLQDTQYRVACFLNDREHTAFDVYSPLRIHVYDKDGNHTGPRNDGTLETQIPNSEYFEENNATHVIIYGSGEYRAVYEAYDNGNATFSITRQVADEGLKIISYNDVRIKKTATYTVTANHSKEAPLLEVDLNGDKVTDEKIKPSSYQYYPSQQKADNNDENDGERSDGLKMDPMTIAGIGLIAILIVALLVYRSRTTTDHMPTYTKQQKLPTQQIQQPPPTSVCPSCRTTNPSNTKYCTKCGKPIQQSSYCEECGKEIPTGSAYCVVCGDKQGAA